MKTKRNTKEIQVWMIRNGLRAEDIRKDLGYKSSRTVRSTIYGEEDNRRVLRYFLERGCPAHLLALPNDMKEAA